MLELNENIFSTGIDQNSEDVSGLILKRIKLLSRRRIAWLRKIWGEITSDASGEFNSHTEVDGYLDDRDQLSLEKEWYEQEDSVKDINYLIEETEQELSGNNSLKINSIVRIFGLNRQETDILQTCLAISFDPNLGRVFAYLQDHSGRSYVTESLVAKLFGYGNSIVIQADSPLKRWGLIRETVKSNGEPNRLECDPFIKNRILGVEGIDESLINYSSIQPLKKPLSNWQIQKTVNDIRKIIEDNEQNKLRIFIEGTEGSGRKSFAAIVCGQFGLPLLTINTDLIPENRMQLIYMTAQRQAFLSDYSIAWYGKSTSDLYWLPNIPSVNIQFVIGEAEDYLRADDNFLDFRITLPPVTFDERLSLWRKFVPLSSDWEKNEMEEMVLRHETTVGQIVSIGKKATSTISEAYDELRADTGRRLGNLAQPMRSEFKMDDLIIPEQTKKGIEDFIFEATDRIQFWEQPKARRLFPQGRSLIGLFTGNPGTGKTLAAQVIAATLKLDLYRIDLSSIVSKYIGESSKNIERILSRAKNMNVILFFDEADSLFGKRTEIKDAHDRYANTDTNYLLQAIENYPGIIILASNQKTNIDNGFMRRLRYLLEFPKPESGQRQIIWIKLIEELSGKESAERIGNDLIRLADLLEITGAQIKQAILSAIFISRREKTDLNIQHLLRGLERELAKEGKGFSKHLNQNFIKTL